MAKFNSGDWIIKKHTLGLPWSIKSVDNTTQSYCLRSMNGGIEFDDTFDNVDRDFELASPPDTLTQQVFQYTPSNWTISQEEMLSIFEGGPNLNTVGEHIGCRHEYKRYIGFVETYEYCTKCNEKRG